MNVMAHDRVVEPVVDDSGLSRQVAHGRTSGPPGGPRRGTRELTPATAGGPLERHSWLAPRPVFQGLRPLADPVPAVALRWMRVRLGCGVPVTVFAGGEVGQWRVEGVEPVTGPPLPPISRLAISDDPYLAHPGAAWVLRGVPSNLRYTRRHEHDALAARQADLDRPEATRAALIPITKSEAWWELAQDERRTVFEETSHHIAIGLEYLPAIARRLYHGHDLDEPFDFLTWFEYAPEDAPAFEDLVVRLRATREWEYVQREVDVRLAR